MSQYVGRNDNHHDDPMGIYDHYSSDRPASGDTSGLYSDGQDYDDGGHQNGYEDYGDQQQQYRPYSDRNASDGDDGGAYYYDQNDDNASGYPMQGDDDRYEPYNAQKDTGHAMMGANSDDDDEYDDDDDDDDRNAYDDDHQEEYYDDEGKPLDPDGPGVEYYHDEHPHDDDDDYYYDENDEEERRRRARRRRAWCCCLILLCCLLIIVILLIIFLLGTGKDDEPEQTPAPTYAPFIDDTDDDYYYDDELILSPGVVTTPMAPYTLDCDDDEESTAEGYRHVWDQCACDGAITIVPDDVAAMRELIIDKMAHKFYDDENYTLPLESCDPANQAFLWLASGDNRDAGEARQRFSLALTFFQLNGTVWDFKDEWMGELNECLWMGVQCNNRDTVNSLQLDTNNIFGLVSW